MDTLVRTLGLSVGVLAYKDGQDSARGPWASPRSVELPDPPWPAVGNPMLDLLLAKADADLSAGVALDTVLVQLLVNAWFEGGIDGYDRGQLDAREELAQRSA